MRESRFVIAVLLCGGSAMAQGGDRAAPPGPERALSQVLGRPTDRSVTLSVLSEAPLEVRVQWGRAVDQLDHHSQARILEPGQPVEFELNDLVPNAPGAYRLESRAPGAAAFAPGSAHGFHTQRAPGAAFTFALQGDSHPERMGKMFDPDLYTRTMRNVSEDAPDFYLTMGDDFSIERLISRGRMTQADVDAVYAHQRGYLGIVGRTAPLFLVNGNHEEAARYLLNGTATSPPVLAGRARVRFFPLPAPDGFYSGNSEPVEHVGLPRDYYAWTWGDALFVVIDPYWHSTVQVDAAAGGRNRGEGRGKGRDAPRPDNADDPTGEPRDARVRGGKPGRDMWAITLGDAQYQWLAKTLKESNARFKFVLCHHVLGTGRGGVEVAGRYEWGGRDQRGIDRFAQYRPTWDLPIHELMRRTGVTIFFQGHDHLYARQELDGVVYQSVPNPADPTFTAFNREAYRSGDVLPNSGHLRVTVSPASTKVEYVRSFRPQDEGEGRQNRSVAHAYSLAPRSVQEGGPR